MGREDLEIQDLRRRARGSIEAAEMLLLGGHPDFAASRAYYAAFYCASALLLSAGKDGLYGTADDVWNFDVEQP